eukprot:10447487-Alexandrium_andersonii.AAC.1
MAETASVGHAARDASALQRASVERPPPPRGGHPGAVEAFAQFGARSRLRHFRGKRTVDAFLD